MKITIAQLNPVIGDIDGNYKKAEDVIQKHAPAGSDLVVFPELFITGYPPRDLLKKQGFVEKAVMAIRQLQDLSTRHPETGILMGVPWPTNINTGTGRNNSAVLIYRGKIIFRHNKCLLPTYDVFDEARYFDPGTDTDTIKFKDETLGISVCEDAWNDPQLWQHRHYCIDPIEQLAAKGASLIINISASPFYMGKPETRFQIVKNHALKHQTSFLVVNQTGGNDEILFDGGSMLVDKSGNLVNICPYFKQHVQTIDTTQASTPDSFKAPNKIESVYNALVMGTRDYLHKCGFSKAMFGLSGGIDSAVTCCIAVDAVGRDNVLGVSMPGPYSSEGSIEDSRKLADTLGISFKVIPIIDLYSCFIKTLKDPFREYPEDVTEENIQARLRGNILMALSNKLGHILLSTGNKSELAVGYCTMYGDMAGGLNVISDVPKTMVYKLACHINRNRKIIPDIIITKPPSAELRPDQKDQDSLPPYEILDSILYHYVDEGRSSCDIINMGFDPETVNWIVKTVDRNEYKRRQAAPGLKVTSKAFGIGRRMMIAARYNNS